MFKENEKSNMIVKFEKNENVLYKTNFHGYIKLGS